jgi:ribosomal protein L32
MMYNEKLAVAIKSAGKVLREFKDSVYVPFGAEYSIFIKNLNTVRTLVKVSIDGQNIDESGEGFVIHANSSLDLERYLKNGNLNQGNRFKFIERTGKIEQHRGIQVEDGLVRVEFQFEKPLPKVEYDDIHHYRRHIYHDYWDDYYPYWPYNRRYWHSTSGCLGGSISGGVAGANNLVGSASLSSGGARGSSLGVSADAMNVSANAGGAHGAAECFSPTAGEEPVSVNYLNAVNEAGITVPGSKSDQQFVTVSGFPLEDTSHVIVLRLFGETAQGKRVRQPVTVKTTQKCPTCGHVNKATTKFCAECGTALEIV